MPTCATLLGSTTVSLLLAFVIGGSITSLSCGGGSRSIRPLSFVSTVAGTSGEFGEPFGIAVKDGRLYVSDGEKGEIRVIDAGSTTIFASGLDTPSGIAFAKNGDLIVAESGTSSIHSLNAKGEVTRLAGGEGIAGHADGEAGSALFNHPIGVAVAGDGRIFVTDSYNDRIRVIENGMVRTIAGSAPGFADGLGENARFYTPTGITIWHDKLLVADTGNHRIRVVEPDGQVWTLAGTGEADIKDGILLSASFYQPTGVAVGPSNEIFITDGNAIRRISADPIPVVTTISAVDRGVIDGPILSSRFNRPSGLAFAANGDLMIADSDNRVVRAVSPNDTGQQVSPEQTAVMQDKPEAFRNAQPPRWPFDPPQTKRDIAGTFGELRGTVGPDTRKFHFHNGLDIAGAYGETARFIRTEKVLRPIAAENFNTLRELLRMPSLGYIHIRLGRDRTGKTFNDPRFIFDKDEAGRPINVRVPRGSSFTAGEPIGTLNAMNHVHLIAGRGGSEMNAVDAMLFPGLSDSRPPTIQKVILTDETWRPIETKIKGASIQIRGKTRIILQAFDQVDGNSERRRLGVYRVGYQLLKSVVTPVEDPKWTITFDRLPDAAAVPFVYAEGSSSGATGETIFRYIVTNRVARGSYAEGFIDIQEIAAGAYTLRVLASDYFGNISHSDVPIEVIK